MRSLNVLLVFISVTSGLFCQDMFGGLFDTPESTSDNGNNIVLSGTKGMIFNSFIDDNIESERDFIPYFNLELKFISDTVEAKSKINMSLDNIDDAIVLADVIDELSIRTFFNFGYLDLGLFKTEWGKGDGIHVVDPLNPINQVNGILNDLNKMKRAEIMTRLNFYLGDSGLLEIVYKPNFHPVGTPTMGRWIVNDLSGLPSVTIEETEDFKHSQIASRVTGVLGNLDLGAVYYKGFMTEPGYKISFTDPLDITTYSTEVLYTDAMLFGLEAGGAVGSTTFRTELGYWFTEDHEGNKSHLYNDRLVWLAGVDFTIPGTTMFISIQEYGAYVFEYNEVDLTDVDFGMSYNNIAISNTVVGAAEQSFCNDKMKLSLSGLYLFGANGYMISPSYIWNIHDDFELTISCQFFGGDDEGSSPYYAWDKNDNVGMEFKYTF